MWSLVVQQIKVFEKISLCHLFLHFIFPALNMRI